MTVIPEAATAVLGATTTAGAISTVFLPRSRAALAKQAKSHAARAANAEVCEAELEDEIRHLVTARFPAFA
ncbi:hypothetical protein [Streptomyces sp. NPDC005525]|uniref:hypothetical protein n=1 Tax=Streptomyces sp. NPDC005525 TaxID=3364720 RepID=UPI0036BE1C1F